MSVVFFNHLGEISLAASFQRAVEAAENPACLQNDLKIREEGAHRGEAESLGLINYLKK